jgi:hypothetical protein
MTAQAAGGVGAVSGNMVIAGAVEAEPNEVGGHLFNSSPRPSFLGRWLLHPLVDDELPTIRIRDADPT